MTFMSTLLNIPKTRLMTEKSCYDGNSDVEEDGDEIDVGQHLKDHIVHASRYNNKILKVNSLYQTMHNMVHNGRKISPLTTMVGHTLYEKTHSKELITSFNHLGWCPSYPEIMRDRSKLGANSISRCKTGDVPLPGYVNEKDFGMGRFDNFDHSDKSSLIAPKDSHDTAIVVYQNDISPNKPKVKI